MAQPEICTRYLGALAGVLYELIVCAGSSLPLTVCKIAFDSARFSSSINLLSPG